MALLLMTVVVRWRLTRAKRRLTLAFWASVQFLLWLWYCRNREAASDKRGAYGLHVK